MRLLLGKKVGCPAKAFCYQDQVRSHSLAMMDTVGEQSVEKHVILQARNKATLQEKRYHCLAHNGLKVNKNKFALLRSYVGNHTGPS
jgi:hypothetical protein